MRELKIAINNVLIEHSYNIIFIANFTQFRVHYDDNRANVKGIIYRYSLWEAR